MQVSFAGKTVDDCECDARLDVALQGRTMACRNQCNPEWNEAIEFIDLFPPLCRRMRIHVRDDSGIVVATTFLDMSLISDNSLDAG